MYKLKLSIACTLFTLMVCGSALAAPGGKPTTLKLGGFFPSSSTAVNDAGKTNVSVGIDYNSGQSSVGSEYADYQTGSKKGGRVTSYGLGYAVRSHDSSAKDASPYVGAGLGIYSSSVKDYITKVSKTKTGLGGKIFAGIEFKNGLVLEANYQMLPKANGVTPSGFGLQIGAKF